MKVTELPGVQRLGRAYATAVLTLLLPAFSYAADEGDVVTVNGATMRIVTPDDVPDRTEGYIHGMLTGFIAVALLFIVGALNIMLAVHRPVPIVIEVSSLTAMVILSLAAISAIRETEFAVRDCTEGAV